MAVSCIDRANALAHASSRQDHQHEATRVCTTCARDLPLAQFPKLPEDGSCTHDNDTCKRCWHQWLQSQVASKTPDQISCAQCSNVLGQGEIRALATKKVYERYVPPQTI